MHDEAELDRRVRDWLQPEAAVIERVRRRAAGGGGRRRRAPVAAVSVALMALVALLVLTLWNAPSVAADVPFTIETSGNVVLVRAQGKVWVLPSEPGTVPDRPQPNYYVVERKRP
ncbi:MAG: hypothetical protein R6V57_12615 [Vicinamibacterales bacterium]